MNMTRLFSWPTAAVMWGLVLAVYLGVDAPPPLTSASTASADHMLPVHELFELCAQENDAVRALYTREIVGAGKAVGLRFHENWRDPAMEAGPLPALFLRAVATFLEKSPARLGLFLGSDHPIEPSNRFSGKQLDVFAQVRSERRAHFFETRQPEQWVALFPDIAAVPACVSCHNDHPKSAKRDWQLGDVMGATTWTYPTNQVSQHEALDVLLQLRGGFAAAYRGYVEKARGFQAAPNIGEQWPAQGGYAIPTVAVFMNEVEKSASSRSMRRVLAWSKRRPQ